MTVNFCICHKNSKKLAPRSDRTILFEKVNGCTKLSWMKFMGTLHQCWTTEFKHINDEMHYRHSLDVNKKLKKKLDTTIEDWAKGSQIDTAVDSLNECTILCIKYYIWKSNVGLGGVSVHQEFPSKCISMKYLTMFQFQLAWLVLIPESG